MLAMIELTEADAHVERRLYREPATELGILAYQAAWDAGFRAEADALKRTLAAFTPRLEHVGTTAIRGSAARPIIDVLAGVSDPAAAQLALEGQRRQGYRVAVGTDCGVPGARLVVRWQRGLPTHHIYIVEQMDAQWRSMLLFRDVLRIDNRLAREYEWLRRRFAGLHPANRIAYKRAKATFIESVVCQAN